MRFTVVCLLASLVATLGSAEEVSGWIAAVQAERRWPAPGQAAFEEGVAHWNAGRALEARNSWLRADAWIRRAPAADSRAVEAIARLVGEADRLSRPSPTPVPSPTPAPVPKRRARRPAAPGTAPADARSVMERAEAARRSGQLEKAVRLMRIASMLPGGGAAAARAEAWERELLQPAR